MYVFNEDELETNRLQSPDPDPFRVSKQSKIDPRLLRSKSYEAKLNFDDQVTQIFTEYQQASSKLSNKLNKEINSNNYCYTNETANTNTNCTSNSIKLDSVNNNNNNNHTKIIVTSFAPEPKSKQINVRPASMTNPSVNINTLNSNNNNNNSSSSNQQIAKVENLENNL